MNWNQVSCGPCWQANNPGREPVRINLAALDAEERAIVSRERCSWCGQPTNSGIYVRVHPSEVPFPQPDDDD